MQHHQQNKSIRTNVITMHVTYRISFHYTYKKNKEPADDTDTVSLFVW